MLLSIVGCPDKERFRPYVKRAILFYAEQLISKKLLENIYLKVKFDSKLEHYGFASIEEHNVSGKARSFLIEINSSIGAKQILKALAHEMVHIKQYAYGETNDKLSRWKGTKIDSDDVEYYSHPWEIEAYGIEVGLFTKFATKEKLWEVFEGVLNPDDPIIPEPLGWKKYAN
jgi:hypothetical protein